MPDRIQDRRDLDYRYEPPQPSVPPDRSAVPEGGRPALPSPPTPPDSMQAAIDTLLDDLRRALASVTVPAPDGSVYTLADLEQALASLPDPEAQAVLDAWQHHFTSPDQPLAGWIAPEVLQLQHLYASSQRLASALALPQLAPSDLSPAAQAMLPLVGESLPHAAIARDLESTWEQMSQIVGEADKLVRSSSPQGSSPPAPLFNWGIVLAQEVSAQLGSLQPSGAPAFPAPSVRFGPHGRPTLVFDQAEMESYGRAWQQAASQLMAVRNLVETLTALAVRYASEGPSDEVRHGLHQVANGLNTAADVLQTVYGILAARPFAMVPPAKQAAGWFWSQVESMLSDAVQSIASRWLQGETFRGLVETFAFMAYGEQDAALVQDALWQFLRKEVLNFYTAIADRLYSLLGEWDSALSHRLALSQQKIQLGQKLQVLSLHIRVLREMGVFLEEASRRSLSPVQIRAGTHLVIDRILKAYAVWQDPEVRRALFSWREPPAPAPPGPAGSAAGVTP